MPRPLRADPDPRRIGLVILEDEPSGPWRFGSAVGILIAVRLCGPRFHLVACLLIALIAVIALTSAATGAKRKPAPNCTWGASSVRVEVVDGQAVVGEPATSGCIPQLSDSNPPTAHSSTSQGHPAQRVGRR
jgi:hypothetical protein